MVDVVQGMLMFAMLFAVVSGKSLLPSRSIRPPVGKVSPGCGLLQAILSARYAIKQQ